MYVDQNFVFFDAANSSGDSNTLYISSDADELVLEVFGTATSVSASVYGIVDRVNNSNQWTKLGLVNTTSYEVETDISAKGIYSMPVGGLSLLKITLNSVSGGTVSVFGKVGK